MLILFLLSESDLSKIRNISIIFLSIVYSSKTKNISIIFLSMIHSSETTITNIISFKWLSFAKNKKY